MVGLDSLSSQIYNWVTALDFGTSPSRRLIQGSSRISKWRTVKILSSWVVTLIPFSVIKRSWRKRRFLNGCGKWRFFRFSCRRSFWEGIRSGRDRWLKDRDRGSFLVYLEASEFLSLTVRISEVKAQKKRVERCTVGAASVLGVGGRARFWVKNTCHCLCFKVPDLYKKTLFDWCLCPRKTRDKPYLREPHVKNFKISAFV